VKLSAPPPPPPPPPPDQSAPQPPAPDPNDPNANIGTNAPAEQAPAGQPAKPLQWPRWYGAIDDALIALVLLLAFATASFAARNSDLWLHLAAGKRLLAGEYTPGTDPFSYSGAERPWVNHSWLFDAGAYLLYGGQGRVLVIAKALAMVLAFGLLVAIRRPKFALWPWAACACAAVLASAPQFVLRPHIASVFFLALTMFLLFRVPHKPNSWRFPALIGGTFWLWANCDQWFFLGPVALALVVVGELVQSKVLGAPEGASTDDEPLGALPDRVTLLKALGIGLLACTLTPHHVRVWELPFELVGAPGADADPRFKPLLYAPIDGAYSSNAGLGYNANGLAYALLFVGGAVALGFGPGRVRGAHVGLWIGFAGLSLVSIYAIPFFAVAAVPLVAAQLNSFSAKAELKTWGDPKSRFLVLGSSLGRGLSLLGAVAACVLAYPGWAHPDTQSAVYARRVSWSVEVDPALARAAGQVQEWRAAGRLPAEARGFVTSPELANYMAWFAPQEKVFFNARFNHHRPELADFLAVRRGLALVSLDKDERPDRGAATAVLAKAGAEFVAVYAGPADGPQARGRAEGATELIYRDWANWSPWYTDGRTSIFGWRAANKPSFGKLRLDPVVLAFGPKVERANEVPANQPLVPLGWEAAFIRPPKAEPSAASEAHGWVRFKNSVRFRQEVRASTVAPLMGAFPASTMMPWPRFASFVVGVSGAFPVLPRDPSEADDDGARLAAPVLALRAARRAIADDPEHPEPYFALSVALADPDLPFSESERFLGQITALRQCLIRMPKPGAYRRGQFAVQPAEVAYRLAKLLLNFPDESIAPGRKPVFVGFPVDVAPLGELFGQAVIADDRGNLERVPFQYVQDRGVPQGKRLLNPDGRLYLPLDAGHETLQLARQYAAAELAGESADEIKKRLKGLDDLITAAENAMLGAKEALNREKRNPNTALPRQVTVAISNGLAAEALKMLSERSGDLDKEYKHLTPVAVTQRLGLELLLGRVEDATENLATVDTPDWAKAFATIGFADRFQLVKYQRAVLAGEYKTAGDIWQALAGRGIGTAEAALPARSQITFEMVKRLNQERVPPQDNTEAAQAAAKLDAEKRLERMLKPPVLPLTPLLRPIASDNWRGEWLLLENLIRQSIAQRLQNEAEFFTRRGVLSLLEGDIPAAKQRFEQARREPPAGWGIGPQNTPQAARYLNLIERAAARSAP
jgi:hypothetical protein